MQFSSSMCPHIQEGSVLETCFSWTQAVLSRVTLCGSLRQELWFGDPSPHWTEVFLSCLSSTEPTLETLHKGCVTSMLCAWEVRRWLMPKHRLRMMPQFCLFTNPCKWCIVISVPSPEQGFAPVTRGWSYPPSLEAPPALAVDSARGRAERRSQVKA